MGPHSVGVHDALRNDTGRIIVANERLAPGGRRKLMRASNEAALATRKENFPMFNQMGVSKNWPQACSVAATADSWAAYCSLGQQHMQAVNCSSRATTFPHAL